MLISTTMDLKLAWIQYEETWCQISTFVFQELSSLMKASSLLSVLAGSDSSLFSIMYQMRANTTNVPTSSCLLVSRELYAPRVVCVLPKAMLVVVS